MASSTSTSSSSSPIEARLESRSVLRFIAGAQRGCAVRKIEAARCAQATTTRRTWRARRAAVDLVTIGQSVDARRRRAGLCRNSLTAHTSVSKSEMAAHYCFSKWEKDSASPSCRSCGADFGLTTRRHHCRYCGRLFCVKCANQQAHAELLPPLQRRSEFSTAYRAQKVVRLCVGCADGLRGLCAALAKGEARAAGYFLDGTSDDDTGLRGLLWPLARDAAGASFAHLAVGSGSLDVVRWLCERVASPSQRQTSCRAPPPEGPPAAPLALAAADSHVAILRYLAVDRGAASPTPTPPTSAPSSERCSAPGPTPSRCQTSRG